jgi:hypothetical protein
MRRMLLDNMSAFEFIKWYTTLRTFGQSQLWILRTVQFEVTSDQGKDNVVDVYNVFMPVEFDKSTIT